MCYVLSYDMLLSCPAHRAAPPGAKHVGGLRRTFRELNNTPYNTRQQELDVPKDFPGAQ